MIQFKQFLLEEHNNTLLTTLPDIMKDCTDDPVKMMEYVLSIYNKDVLFDTNLSTETYANKNKNSINYKDIEKNVMVKCLKYHNSYNTMFKFKTKDINDYYDFLETNHKDDIVTFFKDIFFSLDNPFLFSDYFDYFVNTAKNLLKIDNHIISDYFDNDGNIIIYRPVNINKKQVRMLSIKRGIRVGGLWTGEVKGIPEMIRTLLREPEDKQEPVVLKSIVNIKDISLNRIKIAMIFNSEYYEQECEFRIKKDTMLTISKLYDKDMNELEKYKEYFGKLIVSP